MNYDVGDICNDDWKLAQRLMVHGCDPLPRRRCFARAPQFYTKPLPFPESIWVNTNAKTLPVLLQTRQAKPRWVLSVHLPPRQEPVTDSSKYTSADVRVVVAQQGSYLANFFNSMDKCEKEPEGPIRFRPRAGTSSFSAFQHLGQFAPLRGANNCNSLGILTLLGTVLKGYGIRFMQDLNT
ncbi:hypothetical protein M8C21_027786 [Ambrosia artemisiifolia]|uniref:Uncharacterized protein n=1 Tax=Ambrosia artemisiifolia TaxID=4212 RepID=A0AAD5D1W0_AMBAR|nr:hypothetical protein M8C21_027786 [Ambrosia artemisiifolia]